MAAQRLMVEGEGQIATQWEGEIAQVSSTQPIGDPQPTLSAPVSTDLLAQRQVPPDQSPVTSVDELSDIQPGIWYYDAIVNLVEKYQCVAGYPDGTFRPRRSISRAEMAVLLNNCLEAGCCKPRRHRND